MTSRDILLFSELMVDAFMGRVWHRTFGGHMGHNPLDPQIKFLIQKLRKEISVTYYQGFYYISMLNV